MGTITVTQLSKAYRQYPNRWSRMLEWFVPWSKPRHTLKWILQDVNFHVSPGEAVGIIGVNGAGKSTLLKLITGTTQPTTGSVKMVGRVAALLELGMGFHSDFTGRQNAIMAAQLLGLQAHEVALLIPEIEAFSEIGDYIDQPVRVYSSGMQVRLAFAVATAVRPDILIVDEALSVGDGYFQHKCFSRIRQFQVQGTTLLFVSHDLAVVRALCGRSIWLDNGAVREVGETKAVLDTYATALYAKEQNVDNAAMQSTGKESLIKEASKQKRDCRLDFINNSNLRNDIEVFEFNMGATRWGDGLAKITATYLQDTNGIPLSWIIGGEEVVLGIEALALQELRGVFVGFQVRDRLGQILFGDSTYITTIDNPVTIRANYPLITTFSFLMPMLPQGIYAIVIAIATGTQQEHLIHEWLDEALFFESHNATTINGLIGVPMHAIEISEFISPDSSINLLNKPISL
jgi:lipopolysaccharide transport system ATP-binding protein